MTGLSDDSEIIDNFTVEIFFISVRQIYEAEKKLRVSSLLKYQRFSLRDLKRFTSNSGQNSKTWSQETIPQVDLSDMSDLSSTDRNLITYLGGYSEHVLLKNVSCSNCRSIFICNREDLKLPDNADVNTYFDDNDFHLLEVRNRGGLKYPNSFSFNFVAVTYCIFKISGVKLQVTNNYFIHQIL